jgi:hypothetical protein
MRQFKRAEFTDAETSGANIRAGGGTLGVIVASPGLVFRTNNNDDASTKITATGCSCPKTQCMPKPTSW